MVSLLPLTSKLYLSYMVTAFFGALAILFTVVHNNKQQRTFVVNAASQQVKCQPLTPISQFRKDLSQSENVQLFIVYSQYRADTDVK